MSDLVDNTIHIAVETMRERNQLKEQVRELERHYDAAWDEISRLQKSIDKAREILEQLSYFHLPEVKRALDALEGK